MKFAETALLLGVRNRLRQAIDQGGGGYSPKQCEIEHDEMAPATVGDLYVAVLPGGWRPGPRHNSSGGATDLVYGASVLVIKRIGNVPRDRTRDAAFGTDSTHYLGNLDSLNEELDRVLAAVDFRYEVTAIANAIIADKTGSQQGFVEPLKFSGIDQKPRHANPELFGGSGDGKAGLVRAIHFHGARRLTVRG